MKPKPFKGKETCEHLKGKRNYFNPYKVVDNKAYCMECYYELKEKKR